MLASCKCLWFELKSLVFAEGEPGGRQRAEEARADRNCQLNDEKPLFGIPNELLDAVVETICEDPTLYCHSFFHKRFVRPNKCCPQLPLRSTCRRFQERIDGRSKFWTSLSGTQHGQCVPHPRLLERWIELAGASLELYFHISPPLVDCEHRGEVVCDPQRFTRQNLEIFMEQAPRWAGIAFDFDDDMASVYLDRKPSPKHLKLLELNASRCSNKIANELLNSITEAVLTVQQLSWTSPQDFRVLSDTNRLIIPALHSLHVAGAAIDDVVAFLNNIEAPQLDTAWLQTCREDARWTSGNDIDRWVRVGEKLVRALVRDGIKTPQMVTVMDDIASNLQEFLPLVEAVGACRRIERLRIDTACQKNLTQLEGVGRTITLDSDGIVTLDYDRNTLWNLFY
ncbi:hypothetical protein FA15DRAFT_664207 [Coprinopsis marcescibilis]|uniref:F-box domain-containing protein n=1 Tax=Coprinopsis marcescibilis TaxID=230819 RepID=A0A5C3LB83_COPMA|nr:hypothetical protein FA15DRAFT_664207 [Coprinopsis marcescibilis]